LAVIHVKDVIITSLGALGVVVLIKKLRIRERTIFVRFYLPLFSLFFACLLILVILVGGSFGDIGYDRPIMYAMVFQPFLVGPALWDLSNRLRRRKLRSAMIAFVLFLTITISLVQVLYYQPLIPSANVLSAELPRNEYLYDLRMVNSVCQVNLIFFAQKESPSNASVTSDEVTRYQIYGFADETFSNRHIWFSPLDYNGTLDWNIFLLHYDGTAGPLAEKAENRTQARIQTLQDTSGNLVYDSGECFMIARIKA